MIQRVTIYHPSDFETATVPARTITFQIEICELELDRLRHEKLLGFTFKKNKYRFLSDLRDVIANELARKFEELEK
jgi:hypothetical protein